MLENSAAKVSRVGVNHLIKLVVFGKQAKSAHEITKVGDFTSTFRDVAGADKEVLDVGRTNSSI